MEYYRKPEWRAQRREIFLRYFREPVSYESPDLLGSLPDATRRMPVPDSSRHKFIKQFEELGLFNKGNPTELGRRVRSLVESIVMNIDRKEDELRSEFGTDAFEAAVKAGLIYGERHYMPRNDVTTSLWDQPLEEAFAYLMESAYSGRLKTKDGLLIIPKVVMVRDKKSRSWYRRQGPYFTLEQIEKHKIDCGLSILIYAMFFGNHVQGRVRSIVQDYELA